MTGNMKGVPALLFAAYILFVTAEAAPSTNLGQNGLEEKWVRPQFVDF